MTVQEWKKFYIGLIVLYVHSKIAIMFDHSRLGLENKFPKQNNQVTHHLTRLIDHSLSNHSDGETLDILDSPEI